MIADGAIKKTFLSREKVGPILHTISIKKRRTITDGAISVYSYRLSPLSFVLSSSHHDYLLPTRRSQFLPPFRRSLAVTPLSLVSASESPEAVANMAPVGRQVVTVEGIWLAPIPYSHECSVTCSHTAYLPFS